VEAGQTVELLPALVTIRGLSVNDVMVMTADGRQAGPVSGLASTIALPAGDYKIQLGGGWKTFTVAEGQALTISAK
jgi:hypothetical protein